MLIRCLFLALAVTVLPAEMAHAWTGGGSDAASPWVANVDDLPRSDTHGAEEADRRVLPGRGPGAVPTVALVQDGPMSRPPLVGVPVPPPER